MSPARDDHGTSQRTRTFGAAIATVCIVGLAGLIFLHAERQGVRAGEASYAAPTTDSAPSAFLHAPALDGSVPSADQVFASRRSTSGDSVEPAPTF